MNVVIVPLRVRGRRIPPHQRIPGCPGLLTVFMAPDHDRTMRRQAVLHRTNKRGAELERVLGPLYDPILMAADDKGMVVRGLEPTDAGAEIAQEWWVRLVV